MMGILMNKSVQLERIWRGLIEGYFSWLSCWKRFSSDMWFRFQPQQLAIRVSLGIRIELTVDYATLRRETSEYGTVMYSGVDRTPG